MEYKPEDEHELLRSISPALLHKDSEDTLVPRDLESDVLLPRRRPRAASSLRSSVISWAGPDDPSNRQNWSKGRKWLVSMCCIVPSFSCLFSAAAPTMAAPHIQAAFEINDLTVYAILTVFLAGLIFGPILWGPGSELYGRRRILVPCMTILTVFHLGQVLSENITTLLVCRFFAGFFGAAPVAVGGGLIADVWSAEGRGPVIGLYIASGFLGPVFGPVVAGFIVDSGVNQPWRWVLWSTLALAGLSSMFVAVFMRETFANVLLREKLHQLRKENPYQARGLTCEHDNQDWSFRGIVHSTVYRPFDMLFHEPILLLVTIYISALYGILFALFEAIPIIFIGARKFSFSQSGLVFLGIGLGVLLGCVISMLSTRHYPALVVHWKGYPPPEQRLFGAMIGAPCLVVGALVMGWTGQYTSVHWIVPVIGTVLIGAAICSIFISFIAYVVDVYLAASASAIAANSIIRCAVAAVFPLFTTQMYHALGINWASTLFAALGLILAPMPFLFYKFGTRIRKRSKFAACMDLKIAEEMPKRINLDEIPLDKPKITVWDDPDQA